MDIAGPDLKRKERQQRWVFGGIALAALATANVCFTRMKPAAPVVERSTIRTDTVKRGALLL